MSLSDDLRRAIVESGLSVNAISKECGITQPALNRFVREERGITIETANKLADFFGLRLMPGGDEKPKRKKKATN